MKRKIKIERVSTWSIITTIIVAILFGFISFQSEKEFHVLQTTTEQYILCEKAAKQLQDGSDYLTEQVRLYVMTTEREYLNLYFEEADETQRRENAVTDLKQYFSDTETFDSLESALQCSQELMNTEYYSMRLILEATEEQEIPDELKTIELTEEDKQLSNEEKIKKAQKMVCDNTYQEARTEISNDVTECMNSLIKQTRNKQGRATTIFSDMYLKLEIGIVILVVLMLFICFIVRRLVVRPLISYNRSIQKGEIFPTIGAEELQSLAENYNSVYAENQETQKIIRHQAEHDTLTELLNRGSYEKVLAIYEKGEVPFALILVDVDIFKFVNDTYGHAVGDEILKKVSRLLKNAFRSVDYVCRIGGDEFAVVMVDVTSNLQYTVEDKITSINKELAKAEENLPAISLSVGVAFSDRENPGESIFKDADKALYYIKEHGKSGCGFY